ncbi:YybH family protein [Sphingomonas sp. PR090111-T3T-6A]|uniref:YybH family protein n=1 Tax=Sphingomonas sp. PR090111-T3T-6A TaxID=685778 RepID=UPI00036DBF70|nr:nuclear transport factor 2 family protein [Sphingomonas sp. PR090111-T3T-6A]
MKALAALLLVAAAPAPPAEVERAAILHVVADMERAWNRGDFAGYMAGFANPGVVFVSGGKMQADWQGTLDHYVRDYGGAPERRGMLHFYDMKVDILAPDAAMLVGHYHLERPEHPQEGINTHLFRKIKGRWVIAMNHVSSYEAHASAR